MRVQVVNDAFPHQSAGHYCVNNSATHNTPLSLCWAVVCLSLLRSIRIHWEPHQEHVELPQGQAAYWKADDRFDQSHSWTYTLLINDRQRRFTEGENDFALL